MEEKLAREIVESLTAHIKHLIELSDKERNENFELAICLLQDARDYLLKEAGA